MCRRCATTSSCQTLRERRRCRRRSAAWSASRGEDRGEGVGCEAGGELSSSARAVRSGSTRMQLYGSLVPPSHWLCPVGRSQVRAAGRARGVARRMQRVVRQAGPGVAHPPRPAAQPAGAPARLQALFAVQCVCVHAPNGPARGWVLGAAKHQRHHRPSKRRRPCRGHPVFASGGQGRGVGPRRWIVHAAQVVALLRGRGRPHDGGSRLAWSHRARNGRQLLVAASPLSGARRCLPGLASRCEARCPP